MMKKNLWIILIVFLLDFYLTRPGIANVITVDGVEDLSNVLKYERLISYVGEKLGRPIPDNRPSVEILETKSFKIMFVISDNKAVEKNISYYTQRGFTLTEILKDLSDYLDIVLGFYNISTETIYINDNKFTKPGYTTQCTQDSILVHEIIHWFQVTKPEVNPYQRRFHEMQAYYIERMFINECDY